MSRHSEVMGRSQDEKVINHKEFILSRMGEVMRDDRDDKQRGSESDDQPQGRDGDTRRSTGGMEDDDRKKDSEQGTTSTDALISPFITARFAKEVA